MVIRRKPKAIDIGMLEDAAKKEVDWTLSMKRKEEEKCNQELLSANFYFTVVFPTQKERDAWCKANGLTLRDNDYISCIKFQEWLEARR